MAEADHGVLTAKRKMDDDIRVAQQGLDDAAAILSQAFGNAQAEIREAQAGVEQWQKPIGDVLATMKEYADAPIYQPWKKLALPGLGVELAGLQAKKWLAEGVLKAAEAIMQGTDYVFKEGAVAAAKKALEGAETLGQAGLDAARVVLAETDKATQLLVEQATNFVHLTRTGVEHVALQGAIEACEAYKTLNRAAYDAAVSAIEGLMKATEYLAFTAAQAGVLVAKGFTTLLDATKEGLHMAEEASGAIATIMEEIVKFGAKAVNIEAISLSGTLRGALGLGGDNSRPLSASVKGYLVGERFEVELDFEPKDSLAFVKALFTHVWGILKAPLNVVVGAAAEVTHGNVKFALASMNLPELSTSHAPVAFRTVVSSKGHSQWLDGLLPSQHADFSPPALSSGCNGAVKFIAPLIAVEDQVTLLPFAVARQRFIEYGVEGTHEGTEQAKRQGLVGIPLGPFTVGPPSTFVQS